ncbi:hypothetical protein [Saccharothrix syringae]|uniref:Uncharacterized protein n=1 Tax=Saccharothrix syringae TaxID=103733 RepID=A0A5Q0H953_SACSY|nr:hypothetical protein [Saccharothrix syringae]QFZ22746.1 hypothetical protein EKG83_39730 [Saccharothrix syringae]
MQSSLARVEIDWEQFGLEPRWLKHETSDCVAALQADFNSGAAEQRRLLAGAAVRDETVLFVDVIGTVVPDELRSTSDYEAFQRLPDQGFSVGAKRLPVGTRPALAGEVSGADRDLGLRLLNRDAPLPWWALDLSGDGRNHNGRWISEEPPGELRPILHDSLGEPVAAVWVSPDERLRWYLVPDGTDWNTILDWLVHQAIPAYIPSAASRFRLASSVDPSLETEAESQARRALVEMEERHAVERAHLENVLAEARAAADSMREGLLYSSGDVLVQAVAQVLTAAGFAVDDLDVSLGATISADLLVTLGSHRRLIEVKSAGRSASESLVLDLKRHLDTWAVVSPGQPVEGGTLVVNHDLRVPPSQRTRPVYRRREFVASLTLPVISTLDLYDWWRAGNWDAIRTAVWGRS